MTMEYRIIIAFFLNHYSTSISFAVTESYTYQKASIVAV